MIKLLRNPEKRMERRAFPIHGYIGPNGGGKTCAMVWDTLPSLEAGRFVLSTVRLLDYDNPRPCDDPQCTSDDHEDREYENPLTGQVIRRKGHAAAHPQWIRWDRWSQLLEVEHCDVLADEITGVASSRESQSMPSVIANALVQLRRRDVVFRWSAPSWSRADLIVRECSQAVTLCTGSWSVEVEGSSDEGDVARMWRHRRLFKWRTYDAAMMDDLNASKLLGGQLTGGQGPGVDRLVRDWHWGPGSPAFAAYSTFDAVSSLGHVSDAGRCLRCDGRRSAPACSCPEYVERARRPRGGSRRGVPAERGPEGPPDGGPVLVPVGDVVSAAN